ncbi:MAG TPA: hypothetical protein VLK58_22705 [Conexibacter sp.]|nr:hypothetical protein [Conexibacter sp.]
MSADVAPLRRFRAHAGAGRWFEREADKLRRGILTKLDAGDLAAQQTLLVFEIGGVAVALAAIDQESAETGLLALVVVRHDLHGATIEGDGGKLSHLVVATAVEELSERGCRQVVAEVAHDHRASKRMLAQMGFGFVSLESDRYEIHATRT